jgi:hypothetical protein
LDHWHGNLVKATDEDAVPIQAAIGVLGKSQYGLFRADDGSALAVDHIDNLNFWPENRDWVNVAQVRELASVADEAHCRRIGEQVQARLLNCLGRCQPLTFGELQTDGKGPTHQNLAGFVVGSR